MSTNFYIDGENVQDQWLAIIPFLHKGDAVHMFESDAVSKRAVYGVVVPAEYMIHRCEHRHKNAMDFQLLAYAAYMCRAYPEREHFIISKDLGFDCACSEIPAQNLHRLSPYSYATKAREAAISAAQNTNM